MITNSTLKPGKPLVRKAQIQRTPMPRFRANKREGGAAHKTALACVACGRPGPSQCAHPNYGRGLGQKQCDSLTFPLCADAFGVRGCHTKHDSGGMSRAERRRLEWHYADTTRAELLRFNNWPASVEAHYQRAIQALQKVTE